MELNEVIDLPTPPYVELEHTPLKFLSYYSHTLCRAHNFGQLVDQEIELRKGHLNDTLQKLRVVLGSRDVLLKKVVRPAKGKMRKTRAWYEVNRYTRKRNLLVRIYDRSRRALIQLGVDNKTMEASYRPILAEDIKVNGDVSHENRLYQKNDRLPWFWRLEKTDLQENTHVMQECMYCKLALQVRFLIVHSLQSDIFREKECVQRWKEEIVLCQTDLECSERWFKHQAEVWKNREERSLEMGQRGHQCYAGKQVHTWKELQKKSKDALEDIDKSVVCECIRE